MSSMRALLLGLLLIAPSFAYAGQAGTPMTTLGSVKLEAPRMSIGARVVRGAKKTFETLKHPMIISGIINASGSFAIHKMFGVPYDPKVMTTFMVIGTGVGAGYFPLLAKIKAWRSGAAPSP
jgi:hypothetical protein